MKAVRKRLANLPEKAKPDEIDAADLDLYDEQEDGSLSLRTDMRQSLIGEVDRMIEHQQLRAENERLRLERDTKIIHDAVRSAMEQVGVKPGLIDSAVAHFLSQHECAVTDEGKAIVTGKYGVAEASVATVRWMSDEQREVALRSFRRQQDDQGPTMRALASLQEQLH